MCRLRPELGRAVRLRRGDCDDTRERQRQVRRDQSNERRGDFGGQRGVDGRMRVVVRLADWTLDRRRVGRASRGACRVMRVSTAGMPPVRLLGRGMRRGFVTMGVTVRQRRGWRSKPRSEGEDQPEQAREQRTRHAVKLARGETGWNLGPSLSVEKDRLSAKAHEASRSVYLRIRTFANATVPV